MSDKICFDPELHECRPCDCAQSAHPCGECYLCVNGHQACLSPVLDRAERLNKRKRGVEVDG